MQLQTSLRAAALAAALCAAGAAHATITFVTSATAQPFPTATLDSFSDLTINSNLDALSLTRAAGSFRYTLGTTYTDAANSSLYVAPAAGTGAVSTNWYADSLVFTLLSPTYAFGGNFFGTGNLGEVTSGALTLTVTDAQGTTATRSISGNSLTAFNGIVSDVPLRLVTLSITTPSTSVWASADNIRLSAVPVPEPQTWALLLAGGAIVLRLSSRRRQGD